MKTVGFHGAIFKNGVYINIGEDHKLYKTSSHFDINFISLKYVFL